MSHQHVHEHNHTLTSLNSIFIVCIVINLLFVVIEAGAGFIFNSLGLLSDAGHNLSDVFSLLLSLFAFRMSKHRSTEHFTYGYKKSTVLVSLLNAIILLIAVGAIIIESIYKLKTPEHVSGAAVSWTAGIGIIVNGVTAWLLMKNQKHDLNVRGAFLHMAMDTLVSVGVVISGIIIMLTGFVLIDTFISLAIALLILVSTWKLLKESLFLSLDAVPESIDLQEVRKHIAEVPGRGKLPPFPRMGDEHYRKCCHHPHRVKRPDPNGNRKTCCKRRTVRTWHSAQYRRMRVSRKPLQRFVLLPVNIHYD